VFHVQCAVAGQKESPKNPELNTNNLNIWGLVMWHKRSDWCRQNLGRERRKCASFSRPSSAGWRV